MTNIFSALKDATLLREFCDAYAWCANASFGLHCNLNKAKAGLNQVKGTAYENACFGLARDCFDDLVTEKASDSRYLDESLRCATPFGISSSQRRSVPSRDKATSIQEAFVFPFATASNGYWSV